MYQNQGNQSIDLDGTDPGALYHDLATTSGETYSLQYVMAGNLFCAPAVKTMDVDWGGVTVETPTLDTISKPTSVMGWTVHSDTEVATCSTTRLEFVSTTPASCGPEIDDVVTFSTLCSVVQNAEAQPGIADSLCAKLDAASADPARGNTHAENGVLGAFMNEVSAQPARRSPPSRRRC